jgi:hypothetical protein
MARDVWSATDVDTPGSAFLERDSGFFVPHVPLWLGGDLTFAGTVPEDGAASFELQDINLLARLEPHPRLSIFSETRLENTFSFTNGSGVDLDTADVFVERLYLDWLATPHLTIRLGKFLTPFGIWNQIRRAPLTWTVDRPLVTEHTFPEHTTGVGLMYQATVRGWSIDATMYAPAQDELPLRESDESGLTLLGGRVAASHEIGTAYLSAGISAAGAERRKVTGLQPVAGADLDLTLAGNDLLAEFAYARSPENRIDDEWGLYLQDAVPVWGNLYAVGRYEHFRSFREGSIDAGLLGVAWRLRDHFIIKADYQITNKATEDHPRGFLASFSLFF